MEQLTLTRPDDWHVHLRDDAALQHTVPETARCFARALVMPNLALPVVTTKQALAYRQRVLAAVPLNCTFQPLMTIYLTEDTPPDEVRAAKASEQVFAVKLYPAGATTHSLAGVRSVDRTYRVLEVMEACGLPLLVHAETMDSQVDIFDRERVFIERHLQPLVERFSGLRIVIEHATTAEAVTFVQEAPARVAATLTAHHLALNRNALFDDGLRPHYFCAPILKRERHRRALVAAATSGNPKFFLGTDSAPHSKETKESACASPGIYSAPVALGVYAEVFEAVGALERLEGFASFHGADFYGLPRNQEVLRLSRTPTSISEQLPMRDGVVVPFRAGGTVSWTVAN